MSISLKYLVGELEPLLKLVKISENQCYCPFLSSLQYFFCLLLITNLRLHSCSVNSHPFCSYYLQCFPGFWKTTVTPSTLHLSPLLLFLLWFHHFLCDLDLFILGHFLSIIRHDFGLLKGSQYFHILSSPILLQSHLLDGFTKPTTFNFHSVLNASCHCWLVHFFFQPPSCSVPCYPIKIGEYTMAVGIPEVHVRVVCTASSALANPWVD